MSRSYSEFISELLKSLRGEIMTAYGKVDHELKGDLSVVTEIDKNIEKRIIEALSTKYPEIGFHGEEHGRKGSVERYWLIDPIDGTENYVRGLPGATTIIGLVENGEVTQSYIYDPVEDIVYSAFTNMGAYADDSRIYASDRELKRAFIIVATTLTISRPNFCAEVKSKGVSYVGQMYGSGIKAIYMATGKIDGLITHTPIGGGPWDFAPTAFLAKEAGAILTYFDDEGVDSRSYALLSPVINDDLIQTIKEQILNEN